MIDTDRAKHLADVVGAPSIGAGGLLVQSADLAGKLTPILTAFMLALTCAWYLWRMLDRVRFGPPQRRGRSDED